MPDVHGTKEKQSTSRARVADGGLALSRARALVARHTATSTWSVSCSSTVTVDQSESPTCLATRNVARSAVQYYTGMHMRNAPRHNMRPPDVPTSVAQTFDPKSPIAHSFAVCAPSTLSNVNAQTFGMKLESHSHTQH